MSFFPRLLSILVAAPALLALGCTAPPAGEPAAEEQAESFVPLFDGESFAGWEGDPELFRVEDGAVVGGTLSEEIPRNEFLCTTTEYGDFELRLQARTSREDANGGIQFRSRRTPNESEVVGYQADIGLLGGEPPQNIWGALYDEARRRELLAVPDQDELARVFRPGDWNDYVIRAQGTRIQIWINGYQTVDYTETDPDIELTGIIGLQVHAGAPAEIRYRSIEIKPLGEAPPGDDPA
jgi:hypothetical protein